MGAPVVAKRRLNHIISTARVEDVSHCFLEGFFIASLTVFRRLLMLEPVLHSNSMASLRASSPSGRSNSDARALDEFMASIRFDKVCCLGAGYVGGPTMAVLSQKCPEVSVYVADLSESRISKWNSDTLPIYEPGLQPIVEERRGKNLFFTTDIKGAIEACDIIFVAVDTPTKRFGLGRNRAADMTSWELASRSIADYATSSKIVVEKSTVPVRTAESLKRVLTSNAAIGVHFAILSNPEFLAEGTAIKDLLDPDRVLIGGEDRSSVGQYAIDILVDIYAHWVPRDKIVTTNTWSSELSKLVANAFLAQRVSSINSIAMLCEKCGADVREVARAIGADTRIGNKFLHASVGYGGSCFEKDVLSLAYLCEFYGLKEAGAYWSFVKEMNDLQKNRFAQRVLHGLFNTVNRKKIAVFGLAFKKDTGDTRDTPAADVCRALMADGAYIAAYDPKVQKADFIAAYNICAAKFRQEADADLDRQFTMVDKPEKAVAGAHAIIILTEWECFKDYPYDHFFTLMKKPAFIFDGRNILDHKMLLEIGFEVHGVGVPTARPSIWDSDQEDYRLSSDYSPSPK